MSQHPERKLAAVWFADIVGYASVASTDEAAALELVTLLQERATEIVGERGGALV